MLNPAAALEDLAVLRSVALATCALAAFTTPVSAACTPDFASSRAKEEVATAATSAIMSADGEALEKLLAANATIYAASDGSLGKVAEVTARLAEMRAELGSGIPPHRVTGVLVAQDTVAVRIARRWRGDKKDVEGLMAFHIEAGCIRSVAVMD
ncbi:hypothetical protein [Phenylobacterium zucineum]|uniref:hypothetical protein n=1 Tax=Phenylobacterium zucineum TaxID=284016 RepID=UPI00059CB400|nr:hypothetical protein [Phenylobacterium zucineum]